MCYITSFGEKHSANGPRHPPLGRMRAKHCVLLGAWGTNALFRHKKSRGRKMIFNQSMPSYSRHEPNACLSFFKWLLFRENISSLTHLLFATQIQPMGGMAKLCILSGAESTAKGATNKSWMIRVKRPVAKPSNYPAKSR